MEYHCNKDDSPIVASRIFENMLILFAKGGHAMSISMVI